MWRGSARLARNNACVGVTYLGDVPVQPIIYTSSLGYG